MQGGSFNGKDREIWIRNVCKFSTTTGYQLMNVNFAHSKI